MNLTGRPVYMKGAGNRRARQPTPAEKAHMELVATLLCIVGPLNCDYRGRTVTLNHCGTGGGGRKNHLLVIPLCWGHHLGPDGIDGKRMSKRAWQEKYGTETVLLQRVRQILAAKEHTHA